MSSELKPAAITIGSWFERLTPTVLVCVGWIFAVVAGPKPANAPFSAVIAFYGGLGLASIWLIYRICRMGVRFDDQGVTFRGLFSTQRWNWPEVSHFTDGANSITDNDGGLVHFWALKMVLRDGRSFTVPGTTRIPWTYGREPDGIPTVLVKTRQVAERHQIPARMIGRL
jgi:hypothetical protein